MTIQSILKTRLDSILGKIKDIRSSKIQIGDLDENSEVVIIDNVGITNLGMGAVILKTSDGKEFPITSFSADVAKNISDFKEGDHSDIPSVYAMIEQICEQSGLILVKARIYDSGEALRANLYFTGKKELVLRNQKASDAIALATYYRIPILIKKNLLEQNMKISSGQ